MSICRSATMNCQKSLLNAPTRFAIYLFVLTPFATLVSNSPAVFGQETASQHDIDILIEKAVNGTDITTRKEALAEIEGLGPKAKRAASRLAQRAATVDTKELRSYCNALRRIGPDGPAACRQVLKSGSPEQRMQIIRVLELVYDYSGPDYETMLTELLNDESRVIRSIALSVLAQGLKQNVQKDVDFLTEVLPQVVRILRNDDELDDARLISASIVYYSKTKSADAISAFDRMLRQKKNSTAIRLEGIRGLSNLGQNAESVASLLRAVMNDEAEILDIRVEAAVGLTQSSIFEPRFTELTKLAEVGFKKGGPDIFRSKGALFDLLLRHPQPSRDVMPAMLDAILGRIHEIDGRPLDVIARLGPIAKEMAPEFVQVMLLSSDRDAVVAKELARTLTAILPAEECVNLLLLQRDNARGINVRARIDSTVGLILKR